MDPNNPDHFHYQWWHNLIASPFILLWSKRIRKLIVFWDKEKKEEQQVLQPVIPANVITREEFEPRIKAVTDEIHFVHSDLSDKLMAHTAQSRQDSKDTRVYMEKFFEKQEAKLDNFIQLASLNQRTK